MQDADRKTPAIRRRLSQAPMSLTATDSPLIFFSTGAPTPLRSVGI